MENNKGHVSNFKRTRVSNEDFVYVLLTLKGEFHTYRSFSEVLSKHGITIDTLTITRRIHLIDSYYRSNLFIHINKNNKRTGKGTASHTFVIHNRHHSKSDIAELLEYMQIHKVPSKYFKKPLIKQRHTHNDLSRTFEVSRNNNGKEKDIDCQTVPILKDVRKDVDANSISDLENAQTIDSQKVRKVVKITRHGNTRLNSIDDILNQIMHNTNFSKLEITKEADAFTLNVKFTS